jgi:hypothetical protein
MVWKKQNARTVIKYILARQVGRVLGLEKTKDCVEILKVLVISPSTHNIQGKNFGYVW